MPPTAKQDNCSWGGGEVRMVSLHLSSTSFKLRLVLLRRFKNIHGVAKIHVLYLWN